MKTVKEAINADLRRALYILAIVMGMWAGANASL